MPYPQRVPISQAYSFSEFLPGALAFLIGIAGWFYLFYSRAAADLASIEERRRNVRRIRLRRVNAALMLLLAILIAVGYYWFNLDRMTQNDRMMFLAVWLAVLIVLAAILILAIFDVRLTWKLRQALRDRRKNR